MARKWPSPIVLPGRAVWLIPVIGLACLALCGRLAAGGEGETPTPGVGPRGPVGPDAPLSEMEKTRFAQRIAVEGQTDATVRAACERAAKEGSPAVFLPAAEYVFEAEVKVPGGLTVFGEGSKTLCRAKNKSARLFLVAGDRVRFTHLKLQGAGTTTDTDNSTFGVSVSGRKDVRVDHCELLGFSRATDFADEATAQVDHCAIHHNLVDGLGYGVAIYSGTCVLIADNQFAQNRHSLASNGALDWNSPKSAGRYLHKPGVRKTHWEFVHNRVAGNDLSRYELCAVGTHPGMDGTFVVEGNIFEGLRHTDALESDCYAPRQWEKWLHAAYCGRVYYWLEGLKVVPFHFAEYELYVKERSWYEPGGEEVGAGGYWRTSRRYRTPMRGPVLSLAEGFRARRLVAWSGGSIDVPERLVLMDRNPVWWPTRRRAARGETASSSG